MSAREKLIEFVCNGTKYPLGGKRTHAELSTLLDALEAEARASVEVYMVFFPGLGKEQGPYFSLEEARRYCGPVQRLHRCYPDGRREVVE